MSAHISFDDVVKRYRLGSERGNLWGIRPTRSDPRRGHLVTVLNHISFELKAGDRLGLVGPNGGGKSTLLRLVAHVTHPSSGRVRTRGRIAPMLELGFGFHADLTGRENVYFAGTVLGCTRPEMDRKLEEILDFSGLERFMTTPVKRYSSGMIARLGFAVSTAIEADILLIDESLSVGDADFRARSVERIRERARDGATLIIATHNLPLLPEICTDALHLEAGRVVEYGDPTDVVNRIIHPFGVTEPIPEEPEEEPPAGPEPTMGIDTHDMGGHSLLRRPVGAPDAAPVSLNRLVVDPALLFGGGEMPPPPITAESFTEPFTASFELEVEAPCPELRLLIRAVTDSGRSVAEFTCVDGPTILSTPGRFRVDVNVVAFPLVTERYMLEVAVVTADNLVIDSTSSHLEVTGGVTTWNDMPLTSEWRATRIGPLHPSRGR